VENSRQSRQARPDTGARASKETRQTRKGEQQTMMEAIKTELENAVQDLFIKFQNAAGIVSGDVEPLDALALDEAIETTAAIIAGILSKQEGRQ
jgi:hypothetical protein